MRTPPSPPELLRSTSMTTTLVTTARDDRAAPARTPPSRRDRGLRRCGGTITPVDPYTRGDPAPQGPAGTEARQQRARTRYTRVILRACYLVRQRPRKAGRPGSRQLTSTHRNRKYTTPQNRFPADGRLFPERSRSRWVNYRADNDRRTVWGRPAKRPSPFSHFLHATPSRLHGAFTCRV
jgi:hypothetical protein